MQIIRDEDFSGIMMIPLFTQYGINRCNIKDCKEKHITIVVHEQATFGMCEKHFLEAKEAGEINLKLEFD